MHFRWFDTSVDLCPLIPYQVIMAPEVNQMTHKHFVLKFDVLEKGKLGKLKDVCNCN